MSKMPLFVAKTKEHKYIWHSTIRINEFHERNALCENSRQFKIQNHDQFSLLVQQTPHLNGIERNGMELMQFAINYITF